MKNGFFGLIAVIIIIAGGMYMLGMFPSTQQVPEENQESEMTGVDIEPLAADSLVGVWQSADDARFIRTIYENGGYTDTYEGTPDATINGPWVTFDTTSVPSDFPYPVDERELYLQLDAGDDALHFRVAELTEEHLVLVYLDRGGVLTFTRVR